MALPPPLRRRPRVLLVSDLDWTMVDHADPGHDALARFDRTWASEMAGDSTLVFSTGRSPELFSELAAEVPLLEPDLLICSVGTEIIWEGEPLQSWSDHLDAGGWDRERALEAAARVPGLAPQAATEQRRHKLSFTVEAEGAREAVEGLETELKRSFGEEGSEAYHVIFSGGVDVDLLPRRASKGAALAFLLELMGGEGGPGLPSQATLVCGDSGNDVELFKVPGVHGVAVSNAHPELSAWCDANASARILRASKRGPGGILEAMRAFGLVPHEEPRPETVHRRRVLLSVLQALDDADAGTDGGEDGAPLPPSVEALSQVVSGSFRLEAPSGAYGGRLARLAAAADAGGGGLRLDGEAFLRATEGPSAGGPAAARSPPAAEGAGPAPALVRRTWVSRFTEEGEPDGFPARLAATFHFATQAFDASGGHRDGPRAGGAGRVVFAGEGRDQWKIESLVLGADGKL